MFIIYKWQHQEEKKEFSISGQEISQIFSSESIANNTKNKRPSSMYENYSERYSVPNSHPRLKTDIQDGEKNSFRSRSNACISKDKETFLKGKGVKKNLTKYKIVDNVSLDWIASIGFIFNFDLFLVLIWLLLFTS